MTPLFLFPVAMGVNQQQWQKNDHADQTNNDDGFVLPNVLDEAGGVFIHAALIYTDSALCQTASNGREVPSPSPRAGFKFG
jgi:hypothetical protein